MPHESSISLSKFGGGCRQLEESRHQLAADFGQERRALLDELRGAQQGMF